MHAFIFPYRSKYFSTIRASVAIGGIWYSVEGLTKEGEGEEHGRAAVAIGGGEEGKEHGRRVEGRSSGSDGGRGGARLHGRGEREE
jgi:hypothetical protein